MSFGEVEHFATMLSGCESINSGNGQSPDAKYATGVLKLHAADMGAIAGQEGFLDAVKKGAKKTKEWIAALVKAIKDWIAKTYNAVVNKFKTTYREKELSDSAKTSLVGPIERVKKFFEEVGSSDHSEGVKYQQAIGYCTALLTELNKDSTSNAKVLIKNLEDLLDALGETALILGRNADLASKKIPSDISDPDHPKLDKAAMELGTLASHSASAANTLSGAIFKMHGKMGNKTKDD